MEIYTEAPTEKRCCYLNFKNDKIGSVNIENDSSKTYLA